MNPETAAVSQRLVTSSPTQKGNRKAKHAVQFGLLLLAGFVFAVTFEASAEMFQWFVGGLGGLSGAFVYGNTQEHKHAKGQTHPLKIEN